MLRSDDTSFDDRPYRRIRGNVIDRHLQEIIPRLQNIGALTKDRVTVTAGIHEIIGDEAYGIRRPDRR